MIYLLSDIGNIPDNILQETLVLMPPERQQRAMRYRKENDRILCVMAYWLLIYGLKILHGITKPPVFTYGKNGKPYLVDNPNIFFNISHCKTGVVCAISDKEVGVDVQEVRPFNMDIAKWVCTRRELEILKSSLNPEQLFCELWTMKESFIKQQGGSIAQPLNAMDACKFIEQANGRAVRIWKNECHICCFGESEMKEVRTDLKKHCC